MIGSPWGAATRALVCKYLHVCAYRASQTRMSHVYIAPWQVKHAADGGLAHGQFICSLDNVLEFRPMQRNELQVIPIDMTSKAPCFLSAPSAKQTCLFTPGGNLHAFSPVHLPANAHFTLAPVLPPPPLPLRARLALGPLCFLYLHSPAFPVPAPISCNSLTRNW